MRCYVFNMKFAHVSFVLACVLQVARCANILAVLPLDIPSHHRFSEPILKELASRGHKVTVLTPIEDPKPPPNYRVVLVPRMKIWDAVSPGENNTMLSPKTNSFINSQMNLRNRTLILTDFILRSQPMKDFLNADDQKFDVIVCELFHIQPFFMLSHVFDAPIVALSALGHGHFINQQMGNPYELSYSSHENLNLPSRYGFSERLKNTFWTMVDLFERDMWDSEQDELAKKYFSKNQADGSLPTLKELEKNVSVVLVNSHFSVEHVRPKVPAIVEVGGLHIKSPQKLPPSVQKFLDESEGDVVYINLESDVLKSEVSTLKGQTLNKVFSSNPKLRFIWQRNDGEVFEKIDNVLIVKQLTQADILAHKNVKVFITHGGQLNVQDSISRSVPIVCIPMYGDQFTTCTKAREAGFADELNLESLCDKSISDSIQRIILDEGYKKNVERVSRVFMDNQNPPLQTAVYWIEYVLKHKGATHLRSPALKLKWYEYYLVDSLSVIGLSFYFVIWGLNWMFWNVALRKKIPRDDIQHLIEKQKAQ